MENISTRLVNKSVEAFILGLEIYNKPTIKYRAEGFAFFISNAWELMLKAYLVNRDGLESIYFKDKPDRTLSLENCIRKVFTNKNDPLRLNLERIIELRNTSTHFITEDYEAIYAPLFQASVLNYAEKLQEFHGRDITQEVTSSFLTLSLNVDQLSDERVRAKYSKETAERLIRERNEVQGEIQTENSNFSIPIETHLLLTKRANDADLKVKIDKNAENSIAIVRDIKDSNSIYIYTTKKIISLVNKKLKVKKIKLIKVIKGVETEGIFTTNDFQLFAKFYNLKQNDKYCCFYRIGRRYEYSIKTVDFIVEEIIKKPKIIIHIKEELNKNRAKK